MKKKQIVDTTVDNSTYNKVRKQLLEKEGKIRCAWCKYHRGENDTRKYYGTKWRCIRSLWHDVNKDLNEDPIRYPNWKLVSKNRKQWMKKPIKFKSKDRHYWDRSFEWIELEF